jgi:hypothetical protein
MMPAMARKPASGSRARRSIDDWLAHTLELPRDADEVRRVLALDRPGSGVAITSRAGKDAIAAAKALATFKDDPAIATALAAAAKRIQEPGVQRELEALLA